MSNFTFTVSLPKRLKRPGAKWNELILKIYFSEDASNILAETAVAVTLSERNLGPTVFGAFTEGRIEEFIPSRIITNKEFCNAYVGYEVGRILASIHSLQIPISKKNRIQQLTEDMIDRLRSSARWSTPRKMHTTLFDSTSTSYPNEVTVDLLAEEFGLVKRCLSVSGSPVVFSNNDLHEGNLLLRDGVQVTEDGLVGRTDNVDPLVLIDYEYCCYNYRGFDLCHYCCECCQDNTNEEWPGYHIMQNQWPNEQQQRLYITGYLDEIDKITKTQGGVRPHCVSDLPLNREEAMKILLREIRQFVAFPHLLWSIWSFKQAEIFPVDSSRYDFSEYGFDRLAIYYKWKPEILKYLSSEN
uniref:Choline/ethanolamine kinase n=1 Tax=Syphacia muris TaxID=451379 RepID=A0A0N5AQ55_9BILA